ncbi:MAG TPA: sulfate adenylyltransferase subunit CysD [Candidatus Peribacterales bacterium]|nr:sulfate adenylyltransferase subunit CysD [Candidatus Peribacterales bacterium]
MSSYTLTHLRELEAESIEILRETAAAFRKPVLMYSIGKDSSVLAHLTRKAFHPGKPPFPILHIDTTYKFKEMIAFRDSFIKKTLGWELIVHTNEEGLKKGVSPFTHGSAVYTDIMKTEALKQALRKYEFDAAIGGARRDEERSRAKERMFSFRDPNHRWDPKNQRPELWRLWNTRIHKGESMRIFPLSNWTEFDVWHYILLEQIPVVPLYFAAPRPVVKRGNTLIMVDDDRFPLEKNEKPEERMVRFRTLGCYPLSGAVESNATTLNDILIELLNAETSERRDRLIDSDQVASMEQKKREGYF